MALVDLKTEVSMKKIKRKLKENQINQRSFNVIFKTILINGNMAYTVS